MLERKLAIQDQVKSQITFNSFFSNPNLTKKTYVRSGCLNVFCKCKIHRKTPVPEPFF